jgi:hypothetical protein
MADDRFTWLPMVFGNDASLLFKKLEKLEGKRAELLAALAEATAATGPAERADVEAASRALIDGTEPPETTKLAEAEAAVAKIQRDLHVNLRAAFESVEREIAMKVAEQWDSWRPAVIKDRDQKRALAHKTLGQLSGLLAELAEQKGALDWADEPLSGNGTLKRADPQPVVLRFGGGPVPLARVFHRLGLALSDEPQPRDGVSFAPRPPDGQDYEHVPPQHQKRPRPVVSTMDEARVAREVAAKANSVATV